VHVEGKGIDRAEVEGLTSRTGLEVTGNHTDENRNNSGRSGKARESEKGKPSLGTGSMATTFDP
jgi:hypothetical protein